MQKLDIWYAVPVHIISALNMGLETVSTASVATSKNHVPYF